MKTNSVKSKLLVAALAVVCLGANAGTASSTSITVFTTLGVGDSFNTVQGYAIFGCSPGGPLCPTEGMPFTAGETTDLVDAVLALGHEGSPANAPVAVSLESDNNGQPGSILATLTQEGTIPPASSPGLVTFICGGNCPLLASGQQYWLVAVETDSNSFQNWFYSDSDTGFYARNLSGSATGPWEIRVGQIAAFQIDGTPPVPTPEPAAWLLLSTGLLSMVMFAKCASNRKFEI